MIMNNFYNLIFNKSKLFIYSNYFFAFLTSLIFLISAKILNLYNIDKYILVISIATIISSIIYSTGIKSRIIDKTIFIGLSKRTIISILFFLLLANLYLIIKGFSLSLFFLIHILFEISYNLISIYFIKNENTKHHSIFLFSNSLLKLFFLFVLSLTFQNLLTILLIYYFIFLTIFLFYLSDLKIKFEINKKSFNFFDLIFVLTGSLIFQMDKIIGENILTSDDLFIYFFIFKLSSLFQILGSILTQPTRNKILKNGTIDKFTRKEINFFTLIILFSLILINLIVFLTQNYFSENIKLIFNFNNILIFNLWSLAFILHIFNGFYIDGMFIKGYSKKIIFYNVLILIFQLIVMTIFSQLSLWVLSIFIGQLVLTIFSYFYYISYANS